jgi:hypothetical protein
MCRPLAPALAAAFALAAAPASASLIGTIASTALTGTTFALSSPPSATVVTPGAEFSYSVGTLGTFLTGNVEAASFTLSALQGCGCDDSSISVTLDPGPLVIAGFTATITGFFGLEQSGITLSGSTLTFVVGQVSFSPEDSVVVDFTFRDPSVVPAPASAALLGAGLLGLLGAARRRAA